MRNLAPLLIICEIIIAFILGLAIYQRNNVLGVTSINPINKNDIIFSNQNTLHNFYEPKPNSKQIDKPAWMKTGIEHEINSDSLNEVKNYSIDKDPNTFRIVTLGDSHTYGLYVEGRENWSKVLENKLNEEKCFTKNIKYEVINLGMSGYDIQYAIERYKIRGTKYRPDLVIWFVKGDDFTQINENMLDIKKEIKKGVPGKSEVDYWKMAMTELTNKFGEERLLKENMRLINKISQYYSGNLIMMTYPGKESHMQSIGEFVKNRKSTYLFKDIPPIYIRNDLNFSPFDTHPNKEGHNLIAEDLFRYLIDNKLISCN